MKLAPVGRFCLIVLALCLGACSSDDGRFRKETFPVTGEVYVDGKPAAALKITLHDVKGMDQEHPSVSQSMTDEEGKFEVSTYDSGDGVPEGDYVLTFMWGEMNTFSMSYGGPDKLNKRYLDPEKSEFKLTVVKGKPNDMGRIDLTTK